MSITSRYTSIYMGQWKLIHSLPTLTLYSGRPVCINESDFDTLLPDAEEVSYLFYLCT